jgi:hypothetical protein
MLNKKARYYKLGAKKMAAKIKTGKTEKDHVLIARLARKHSIVEQLTVAVKNGYMAY